VSDVLERIKDWLHIPPPAKIALAEDDAVLRGLIEATLREDGHTVVAFPDGNHLLAYLEGLMMVEGAEPPDLIISDVYMPGYTGIEILTALREVDPETPVILITAFGSRDAHEKAFNLNAAMIDKPFGVDALLTTVRCLVR
jgi:DNA-binding response OmpR family regulator